MSANELYSDYELEAGNNLVFEFITEQALYTIDSDYYKAAILLSTFSDIFDLDILKMAYLCIPDFDMGDPVCLGILQAAYHHSTDIFEEN